MIRDFNEQNEEFHVDLQTDMDKAIDGLFSFTIRVNNGVVSDYVLHEHESHYADDPSFP